jgi:ataxia telangiectasia mutated family protein
MAMEQIFSLVNNLLNDDKDTKKRDLKIRTYKIISLNYNIGIIEWVKNTKTLYSYLIGDKKSNPKECAHYRYRPDDYLHKKCRDLINNSYMKKFDDKKKLEVYKDIEKNFKPVFHHFFLENFISPSDWFLKKLNYTRRFLD